MNANAMMRKIVAVNIVSMLLSLMEIALESGRWDGYTYVCSTLKALERKQKMKFQRITISADQMGGLPCIRSLRIPVSVIVDLVAANTSDEEILRLYPDLEPEDIREALAYAAVAVRERELPLQMTP